MSTKNIRIALVAAAMTCGILSGYANAVEMIKWTYVSPTGNDANDGSSAAKAFHTIAKALGVAGSGGHIALAAGRYVQPAPLVLSQPVTLIGPPTPAWQPWAPIVPKNPVSNPQQPDELTSLPWPPPVDDLCKTHACIETQSGDRVITVQGNFTAPVTLYSIVVLGPDLHATSQASSYGVVVDGAPLAVNGVTIVTGSGGPGVNGPVSGTSTTVRGEPGGTGGTSSFSGGDAYYATCTCVSGAAGASAVVPTGGVIPGGTGGGVKTCNCPANSTVVDFSGQDSGNPGNRAPSDSPPGAPGVAADLAADGFTRSGGKLVWVGTVGGNGATGVPGAGGGGGGPGGTEKYAIAFCGPSFAEFARGGQGATGGSGGAPGNGSIGGGQGGAAFGLVIANASVTGTALNVYGGAGGPGGAGGQGGPGGPGAAGASEGAAGTKEGPCWDWHAAWPGGTGGGSGGGAAGGAGGGGAGGNGGPSVDVALVGTGQIDKQVRVSTRGGSGGAANEGGSAGPSGPRAEPGHPGSEATVKTYSIR